MYFFLFCIFALIFTQVEINTTPQLTTTKLQKQTNDTKLISVDTTVYTPSHFALVWPISDNKNSTKAIWEQTISSGAINAPRKRLFNAQMGGDMCLFYLFQWSNFIEKKCIDRKDANNVVNSILGFNILGKFILKIQSRKHKKQYNRRYYM